MKPAWVYFLKPKGMAGPIKIGCSALPKTRLDSYKAWTPWPIEIMGAVPGSYKEESFLHSCFAADHQHGEWFKATPHVVQTIKKIIAAGTIDAVRADIAPVGSIKSGKRRERTPEEKLRISYSSRVHHCEVRMRKKQEAWHAPADIALMISTWRGFQYWSAEKKAFVQVDAKKPSPAEFARLQEYLSDPIKHSVIPSWSRKVFKDSICIPVFGQDAEAA